MEKFSPRFNIVFSSGADFHQFSTVWTNFYNGVTNWSYIFFAMIADAVASENIFFKTLLRI